MWEHMQGWGWGGMGFGMLLFWGLAILILVILVRNFWGPQDTTPPAVHEKSALDILNERYARGEIEREEYEQKKRDIQGQD